MLPDHHTKQIENIYNKKCISGKLRVTVIYGGGEGIKRITKIGNYYSIYLDVLHYISV